MGDRWGKYELQITKDSAGFAAPGLADLAIRSVDLRWGAILSVGVTGGALRDHQRTMMENHELGLSKCEACVGPTLVVTELELIGIILQ